MSDFIQGTFRRFRAQHTFHLGGPGVNIKGGSEFDFDGQTIRYGGKEYDAPAMAGVFGTWYVLVGSPVPAAAYKPKPAVSNVNPADRTDPANPKFQVETAHDEQVVGSLEKTAKKRRESSGFLPVDAPDTQVEVKAETRMRVELSEDEVPVGSVAKTARKRKDFLPVDAADSQVEIKAEARMQLEPQEETSRPMKKTGSPVAAKVVAAPEPAPIRRAAVQEPAEVIDEDEAAAVARADAINKAQIKKALAQPIRPRPAPESETPTGRFTVTAEEQEGVTVGRVRDTGGAAVGAEGEAVSAAQALDASSITAEAILGRARPIGSGPNRAVLLDEPAPVVVPAPAPVAPVAVDNSDVNAEAAAWVAANSELQWKARGKKATTDFESRPEVLREVAALEAPGVAKFINTFLG